MDSTQKPPLGDEIYEAIAVAQYEIDKEYWPQLDSLRRSSILDLAGVGIMAVHGRSSPPLPRQPARLCRLLNEYACALFDAEAKRYPHGLELPEWLQMLATQIESKVVSVALRSGGFSGSLTYHSHEQDIRKAVHEAVESRINAYAANPPQKLLVSALLSQVALPPPALANAPTRLHATINCPSAARKMEKFIQDKGISQTNFAGYAQTTDRTLRSFRKTGKVRRDIFDNIAKAMGTTKEKLMKDC